MDTNLETELTPKRRSIRCPNCSSTNTVKILYGMIDLDDDLQKKLESGKVVLGGCCVGFDDPTRHCNECNFDY